MKKSLAVIVIAGLSLFFIASCLSAQFAPADSGKTYSQRTPKEKIQVFRTQLPEKKFVEIGTVNLYGSSDTNAIIDEMKVKASEGGGDALIHLEAYPGGMTATVVRFLD